MDCQILKGDSARAFVARSHVIATKFDFQRFGRARHSVRAASPACRGLPALPTLKAHVRWEIFAIPDRAALAPGI